LTVKEIRRLFARLITNTVHTIRHWLAWSRWRRRHQAQAKTRHHRRRGNLTIDLHLHNDPGLSIKPLLRLLPLDLRSE
jgi:hypothetical protein